MFQSSVEAKSSSPNQRHFSRMRSEGFSFHSGGLGVEPCSRLVVSAFATARGRAIRHCHWGKLVERVLHGSVTGQIRVK